MINPQVYCLLFVNGGHFNVDLDSSLATDPTVCTYQPTIDLRHDTLDLTSNYT